jgi:membrane associated rhomboid family serine protease
MLLWERGLRRVARQETISRALQALSLGTVRTCPLCRGGMDEVGAPVGARTLTLDACPACRVIWFDRREADALPPAEARGNTPPRILQARSRLRWREIVPWASWSVFLLAAAVTVAGLAQDRDVLRSWWFDPGQPWRHGGATWLSGALLQVHVGNIVMTLLSCLSFGVMFEERLGPWRLVALLLAANGAAFTVLVAMAAVAPGPGLVAGSASLLAYVAVRSPHAETELLLGHGFIGVPMPASTSAILVLAANLALTLLLDASALHWVLGTATVVGLAIGASYAVLHRIAGLPRWTVT